MSITRKQLNDWALMADSSARDTAIGDTLRQVMELHGKQHPRYAAAFYCVWQSVNAESPVRYSESEWYQLIISIVTGPTYRMEPPLRSVA